MFTVRQTEEFVAWLDDLKDKRAQVRIAARLRQAEAGSLGDWQPVEGEVSEMRVHYGPGYRLYFVRRGRVIVVILNAGDKSTQRQDIRRALKLAAELGEDLWQRPKAQSNFFRSMPHGIWTTMNPSLNT